MGADKYSDFGVLPWTKRDKTGQNDPHSATYTPPVGGWWPPPFRHGRDPKKAPGRLYRHTIIKDGADGPVLAIIVNTVTTLASYSPITMYTPITLPPIFRRKSALETYLNAISYPPSGISTLGDGPAFCVGYTPGAVRLPVSIPFSISRNSR